jgi:transcriptional regulator with XRE-family HTH domain
MALALASDVSTRHISYLETGKASPSREMVLRLSRVLTAPPNERNVWLTAAGFAPLFRSRPLDDQELRPFRMAVTRLLEGHDPYPGWALDGDWRIVMANAAGEAMLRRLGVSLGESIVAALVADPTLGGALENWREAVSHLAARLGAEARRKAEEDTAAAALELSALAQRDIADGPLPAAIPTRINDAGRVLSLISLQALFNTAEDATLADLRIELFFPADSETEQALEAIASGKTLEL